MKSVKDWVVRAALTAVAGTAVCFGASQNAEARGSVGFEGRTQFAADQSCLQEFFGAVTNTCGTAKGWEMPLAIDGRGSKNVTVTGFASSAANQVTCQAFAVSRDLSTILTSSLSSLPGLGTTQDIALNVNIAQGSMLYVFCTLNPGGRINKVEWSL